MATWKSFKIGFAIYFIVFGYGRIWIECCLPPFFFQFSDFWPRENNIIINLQTHSFDSRLVFPSLIWDTFPKAGASQVDKTEWSIMVVIHWWPQWGTDPIHISFSPPKKINSNVGNNCEYCLCHGIKGQGSRQIWPWVVICWYHLSGRCIHTCKSGSPDQLTPDTLAPSSGGQLDDQLNHGHWGNDQLDNLNDEWDVDGNARKFLSFTLMVRLNQLSQEGKGVRQGNRGRLLEWPGKTAHRVRAWDQTWQQCGYCTSYQVLQSSACSLDVKSPALVTMRWWWLARGISWTRALWRWSMQWLRCVWQLWMDDGAKTRPDQTRRSL